MYADRTQGLPKRLIEILKTCSVGSKACALLLQIFHALLDHSAHADTLRSIALYITYALRGASQMRTTTEHESVDLPQPERGLHALQMLHSFFCQTPRLDRLQKLTRSVTSKVFSSINGMRLYFTNYGSGSYTLSVRTTIRLSVLLWTC